MKKQPFSLYSCWHHPLSRRLSHRLALALLAVASISSLTACSQSAAPPADQQKQETTSQAAAPASELLSELPEKYRAWPRQSAPITACGFDSIRKSADGNLVVTGWGVIEAAAGVVPESFVLKLDKGGNTFYVTTQPAERNDIADKLGNPALIRSGFTVSIKNDEMKPPFIGTMLIGFDQRLFSCEYKLQS